MNANIEVHYLSSEARRGGETMKGLRAIRQERASEARRYTVKATAEAMGVSRPTYMKWEAHPEKMTIEQAKKLASYLGCQVDDLFYLLWKET